MKDKVSIIVPIYNVEQYLEECVNSILNQTYNNIEVLLVDDCATDKSGDIAKQFEEKDSRCKYIKREKNGGLSAARNTGIKNATGDFLCFIDSDDWISDDYVQSMLELAKKDNSEIVVCDYYMVIEDRYEDGNSLIQINNNSTKEEKIAYIRNHACTKMFKKEFWLNQGLMFPEDIKRGEDMGVTIPLLTYANNISIINKNLYYYRQRVNSLSYKKERTKIDLSFYDKTFQNMLKNSNTCYKEEIEYHAIMEMIYGKTMLMIKHSYSNKDIRKHINQFQERFPNWKKNQYIKNTIFLKKIFVKLVAIKAILILKIMVEINERKR